MEKKKNEIVLIGPVYPYKGGISHYTGLLYRALEKKHNVHMITYRMQYPKILMRREQKDYANDSFKIEGADYLIHTANPFNWIRSAAKIRKMRASLIIIQWWHPYFAPCYYFLTKLLGQSKIMFVCHNVFPHERFPLDHFLTKLALRQGDAFILHSETEASELMKVKKDAVFKINVHPTYQAFQFENMSKSTGRNQLGISEESKVLLFFGYVRPYKGLKNLLHAMALLKEKYTDLKLLIVGDFDGSKEEYLQMIKHLDIETQIEIFDEYIPDREVEKYFSASDIVVLPYESATQSGIVQIAYGFEKPVVVTNVGGLPEVVTDGKTGLVVEAGNPKALSEAIIQFYENKMEPDLISGIQESQYRFSWERIVETIEELQEA